MLNLPIITSLEGEKLISLEAVVSQFNSSSSRPYNMEIEKAIKLIPSNQLVSISKTKFVNKNVNLYNLAIEELGDRYSKKLTNSSRSKKNSYVSMLSNSVLHFWLTESNSSNPLINKSKLALVNKTVREILSSENEPFILNNTFESETDISLEKSQFLIKMIESLLLETLLLLPKFDVNEKPVSVILEEKYPQDSVLTK